MNKENDQPQEPQETSLEDIQRSILRVMRGKHVIASEQRKFHRHHSDKAIKRKKNKRKAARKSKQVNARKRKKK